MKRKRYSKGLKAKIVLAAVGFCAGTVPATKAKRAKKSPGVRRGILSSLSILKWCSDSACLSLLIQPLAAKAYYAKEAGAYEQDS